MGTGGGGGELGKWDRKETTKALNKAEPLTLHLPSTATPGPPRLLGPQNQSGVEMVPEPPAWRNSRDSQVCRGFHQ